MSLVDFNCIKQFVDAIRLNQDKIYGAFIADVNAHGGILGRKIVPVYETFCPIGSAAAVSLCTKFTEDDKVFAVLGNFVDFSGDAQTCFSQQHNTPSVTLVSDITDVLIYGQEELHQGKKPNPYEGIISADGPTAHEYDNSSNWHWKSITPLEDISG